MALDFSGEPPSVSFSFPGSYPLPGYRRAGTSGILMSFAFWSKNKSTGTVFILEDEVSQDVRKRLEEELKQLETELMVPAVRLWLGLAQHRGWLLCHLSPDQ